MNCSCSTTNGHGAMSNCCSGSGHKKFGPHFWSRKKKIEVLENHLEILKEEMSEIEEMISELKAES